MHTRTTTAAAGLLTAGILLTGCSSSDGSTKPSPAPSTTTAAPNRADSCKIAIRDQYEPGTARLTGAPMTPPECAGLSEDELSRLVLDVISENTGG